MEIVYYIVVPIVSSLLGGLFTFLGVKMTLKNEKEKEKKETLRYNKEKNEEIFLNRPEIEITKTCMNFNNEMNICILPYLKPQLMDEKIIVFDYDKFIDNEDFWTFKSFYITNKGNREIKTAYFHLQYKSNANIYVKEVLSYWKTSLLSKNYYCDYVRITNAIYPNSSIKINIFFPKGMDELLNKYFDFYMRDEDGNCWVQEDMCFDNSVNKSQAVSESEYIMHIKDGYNEWFVYDYLYYDKNVKKNFYKQDIDKFLKDRKESLYKQAEINMKKRREILSGEIQLKSKFSGNSFS